MSRSKARTVSRRKRREPIVTEAPRLRIGAARHAIMVLGMHRSGTSAFTRLLNFLGADLPRNLLPPSETNQTGYWESADLVAIHNKLLASAGMSWMDWREFNPDWFASPTAAAFKLQILDLLRKDFADSPLFVIKDPRIGRLWPLWREILEDFDARPLVLIPLRNPLEIAASLKWRDNLIPANIYLLWLRHMLDAEAATRAEPRALATYDSLLEDWQGVAATVAARLKIGWPRRSATVEVEVEKFLAPRLRHHHRTLEDLAAKSELVDWVKSAYAALANIADGGDNRADRSRLDDIRHEFNKASSAFGVALSDAEAELVRRGAEISQISKDLSALRDSACELGRERDALTAVLAEERAATETLRAELSGLRTVSSGRQSELERLCAELQSVQATLRVRDGNVEKFFRDLEATRALLRDSQAENQRLGGELAAARTALEEAEAERKRLMAALSAEMGQRERAKIELDRAASELHSLSDALDARSQQLNLSQVQVRGLEEQLQSESREKRFLSSEIERKNEEVRRIEKAMTGRVTALENLRSTALAESENRAQVRVRTLQDQLVDAEAAVAKFGSSRRNGPSWGRRFSVARRRGLRQLAKSGLFDAGWYILEYPDVATSGLSPAEHYLEDGYLRGYRPNPLFDTRWYLERYEDVRHAGVNPLLHYMKYGFREGRDPGPNFQTRFYLDTNPDVRGNGINPLAHYLRYGRHEGRLPTPPA